MGSRQPVFSALVAFCVLSWAAASGSAKPTTAQTLGLQPIQPRVDYTRPSAEEAAGCTVDPEKRDGGAAWVVHDRDGRVLRRFVDTNSDNFVDVWSYYKDGVEVYRDIDSDFNKKPDQYRWFHTGGARWGVDSDEDGRIDRWRRITAHEVAEELIEAIRSRDEQAFTRLLINKKELSGLGLGEALANQIHEKRLSAPSRFREVVRSQKVVDARSRFVDFGAARPGAIPEGTDGATRDALIYEGASALIDNDGKPEQVQLGVLVAVGDTWRLVEAPQIGSDGIEVSSVFALSRYSGDRRDSGGAPPSEKMQELMADLEKLDRKMAASGRSGSEKLIESRVGLLRQLASVTEDRSLREQWYSQLADMLSAAVVEGAYPKGAEVLADLGKELDAKSASADLKAHVRFQSIWADWGLRSQDPKQDYAKVQEAWLRQLREFADDYPTSPDTAEALLQLGMAEEFAGRTDAAEKWYDQLATEFSATRRGRKAAGALRRLGSIGERITIRGSAIGGGKVGLDDYRGKVVLVQYWATWCEPCKADMAQIKQLNAKYGGRGFTVLGVNLDNSVADAKAFLKENRLPWRHVYDEGGLDGRLASELGVMTVPLMIVVDDKGKVVRRNIHVAELDAELKRLIRK